MGDTGSLFMGGMVVCGLAFALDMPLILILVGIIYIAETLSESSSRSPISKPPMASGSSAWPSITTLRWAAGARSSWWWSLPA